MIKLTLADNIETLIVVLSYWDWGEVSTSSRTISKSRHLQQLLVSYFATAFMIT